MKLKICFLTCVIGITGIKLIGVGGTGGISRLTEVMNSSLTPLVK